MILKRHPKGEEAVDLIISQGEAILDRLEEIDRKIEQGRKQSKEQESDRTVQRRTRSS